jgi:hypothetical protein
MRRAFNDALISAGALIILLLLLVAVDDRVRAQIWQRAASPSVELGGVVEQVSRITHVVVEAMRNQSLAHAPMLIFALAATILVLFMLRT